MPADEPTTPAASLRTARADASTPRCTAQRLDKALVALAPEFSRNHLQSLIERGHVRVDGMPARSASRKRARRPAAVGWNWCPPRRAAPSGRSPCALAVVFEDEHLLVLDKPAGLVVHPAPGNWSGTLLNGLLAHHAAAATLPRAGIVHRLDKDTSGLMVVGKTLPAVTALVRDIAAREVHRRYLALAHGAWPGRSCTIEAPIGRDPRVAHAHGGAWPPGGAGAHRRRAPGGARRPGPR